MSAADARVHGIPAGPFQSNAYVVSQGGEALVMDWGVAREQLVSPGRQTSAQWPALHD